MAIRYVDIPPEEGKKTKAVKPATEPSARPTPEPAPSSDAPPDAAATPAKATRKRR